MVISEGPFPVILDAVQPFGNPLNVHLWNLLQSIDRTLLSPCAINDKDEVISKNAIDWFWLIKKLFIYILKLKTKNFTIL